MARTALTAVTPKGPYPALPVATNALDIAFTAGDVANGNSVNVGARALILARNTSTDTAYDLTIASAPDALGREGDIGPYEIGFGETAAFIVEPKGFRQSDGLVHLNVENAAITLAVLHLPG